jgi:hypothetical protein
MTTQRSRSGSTRNKKAIPDFASRAEMAAWFDTHDMADYWDQLKPVKAGRLSSGINIRLDQETLEKLRSEAAEKGVGPTTLARMWIIERLKGQGRRRS